MTSYTIGFVTSCDIHDKCDKYDIHDYVVHQDASIFMWCLNMAKLQIEQTKCIFHYAND